MGKKVFLPIALLFVTALAFAQNEGTLSFMNSLPQVSYNNPALVAPYKVAISLPSSSMVVFYSNNGFSYNDLISRVHDSTKVDLPKFNNALKSKNYITQALQDDMLRLCIKINSKLALTFSSSAKAYSQLMLPKETVGIFANGTQPYVGKSATISPQVDATAYIESAIGASYSIGKLTIGGRFKYLKGLANANSQNATLNLSVDPAGYALTINADANIRTSGIYNFGQSGFNLSKSYSNYLQNDGMAIDLGATYRLNKLLLGASLIDIGYINWKNNTYLYSLNSATATYTFQGIDLGKVINSNTNYLNSEGDSIQNKFKFKETPMGSYRTNLPGKMYLSAMYELLKNFNVGAVMFSEKYRDKLSTGVTMGLTKNFGRWFTASGTYTVSNISANNLGMGLSLNLPGIQIFAVGDNLLGAPLSGKYINSYLNNLQYFNIRMGLNLVFGREKNKGKTEVPDAPTKSQEP
jgi:hypothetical protein